MEESFVDEETIKVKQNDDVNVLDCTRPLIESMSENSSQEIHPNDPLAEQMTLKTEITDSLKLNGSVSLRSRTDEGDI